MNCRWREENIAGASQRTQAGFGDLTNWTRLYVGTCTQLHAVEVVGYMPDDKRNFLHLPAWISQDSAVGVSERENVYVV